jgi:YgiT-type zinc finger domain-containing protein
MQEADPCEFCDGEMQHSVTRARFHFQGHTIYVDHVPTWVCVKCHEQYFDAPVYKRLEEIAKHREKIKKTLSFPLAEYGMALS